jgi:hypothetical protein
MFFNLGKRKAMEVEGVLTKDTTNARIFTPNDSAA